MQPSSAPWRAISRISSGERYGAWPARVERGPGVLHERAVVAAVAAQLGDRDEHLGGVRDHPGSAGADQPGVADLGGSRGQSRSRSSPAAARSTVASSTSRAAPRSARASARRTCWGVGCSLIRLRLASRPPAGAAGPATGRCSDRDGRRLVLRCPAPPGGTTGGLRSSALGHQILPPRSRLIAVTSTDRTMIVSSRTPSAIGRADLGEEHERHRGEHPERRRQHDAGRR